MASFLPLGLVVWLLRLVSPQRPIWTETGGEPRGNCQPFSQDLLLDLPGESLLRSDSDIEFSNSTLTVHSSRIVCESPGLVKDTFTSVAVIVHYVCLAVDWAEDCPDGLREGTILLSFTCNVESNRFTRLSYISRGNTPTYPAAQQSWCGECANTRNNETGCTGNVLNSVVSMACA
jgi:hypothetical protein